MLSERCVAARRVGAGWPSVRYVMGVLDLMASLSARRGSPMDSILVCLRYNLRKLSYIQLVIPTVTVGLQNNYDMVYMVWQSSNRMVYGTDPIRDKSKH